MLNSIQQPAGISLINDVVPAQRRNTAISIVHAGQYAGVGFASLCILLLEMFGWRETFAAMGVVSCIVGLSCALTIKEPERGGQLDFETRMKDLQERANRKPTSVADAIVQQVEDFRCIWLIPNVQYLLLASVLRQFSDNATTQWLPLYF